MNPRNFLIFGSALCLLLLFTGYKDWSIASAFSTGKWGPKGHSSYHK